MSARRRAGMMAMVFQQDMNQARAANERRYAELLENNAALRARVMGRLERAGLQLRADSSARYGSLMSSATQAAVSRGMGGSSVVGSQRAGILRQEREAATRLDDMLVGREVGADMDIHGERQRIIEGRTDAYPDGGQLLAAMQAQGQAGSGGYGGGAGGGMSQGLFRGQRARWSGAGMGRGVVDNAAVRRSLRGGRGPRNSGIMTQYQRSGRPNTYRRPLSPGQQRSADWLRGVNN